MLGERLVQKLTGRGIDALVMNVHAARSKVFDLAEAAKADPALKPELDRARAEYARAEAALEKARAEHQGLAALTQLLAAMTAAGRDANPIRLAIAKLLQDEPAQVQEQQPPAQQQAPAVPEQSADGGDGTATGAFTVLETRAGKSPGTVRAYCQAADGSRVAVYGKNGSGRALAGAVGKQVQVRYRQGDKGLIALDVRLAG